MVFYAFYHSSVTYQNTFAVRGKLGSVLLAPFACNTRCYWRRSPVTPGVTGAVLEKSACNTGCYRRRSPVRTGDVRL